MTEQLISFETAKLAKEKGYNILIKNIQMYGTQNIPQLEPYNETLWTLYKDYYLAPTQSLLQKWLREKHNLHIEIHSGHDEKEFWWFFSLFNPKLGYQYDPLDIEFTVEQGKTYEEALELGLQASLKLIK